MKALTTILIAHIALVLLVASFQAVAWTVSLPGMTPAWAAAGYATWGLGVAFFGATAYTICKG